MRTRARTAFTLTVCALLAFFVGWVIPFWFGRWYDNRRSKKQWGLFYTIICEPGNCENVGRILEKEHVDFGGAESPVELEAISIMATLTLSLCLLGLFTVLIFHCHVCGKTYSYFMYVIGATIIQFAAALLGFITIILEAICIGEFFSVTSMTSVIEFPWALLCYCIGEILLISSAVIYLLIVYRWKKYRRVYAKYRYPLEVKGINGPEPTPDYHVRRDGRYKSFDRDSFVGYYRDDSGDRFYRTDPHELLSKSRVLSRSEPIMYRPYYTLPGRRSNNLMVSTDNKLYSGGHYLPYATVGRDYNRASRAGYGKTAAPVWYTTGRYEEPVNVAYNIRGADIIM